MQHTPCPLWIQHATCHELEHKMLGVLWERKGDRAAIPGHSGKHLLAGGRHLTPQGGGQVLDGAPHIARSRLCSLRIKLHAGSRPALWQAARLEDALLPYSCDIRS